MTDRDHRAGKTVQKILQPGNGADIQMIGRLVEQQDIGLGDQGTRQKRTPLFAARQRRHVPVPGKTQPVEDRVGAMGNGITIRTSGDEPGDRARQRLNRLLIDQCHACHRLQKTLAAIGFNTAGQDLQQG